MRPPITILVLASAAGPLVAQAPAPAGLWRVATATLARPAALEDGPTGAFWNPAADPHGRLTAGAQVVQTSDILGLSGFVAGATFRVGSFGHVGVLAGRMEVRDLVRTTTSPNSEPGGIAVYEQLAGFSGRFNGGPIALGAAVRLHDARFDADAEQGVTTDIGILATPFPFLTLAAATHFLAPMLGDEPTTEYYAGVEYLLADEFPLAGLPARADGRYGIRVRSASAVDHDIGLGLLLDRAFRVDLALGNEVGYGERSWRPALALSLEVGRYTLGVARSEGLNDVGATYRVLLDVEFAR